MPTDVRWGTSANIPGGSLPIGLPTGPNHPVYNVLSAFDLRFGAGFFDLLGQLF